MATPKKRPITTTILQETITLTPVRKKRHRPSLTLTKSSPTIATSSSHKPSRVSDSRQEANVLKPSPDYDIPTAALNFKEFSVVDENGKFDLHNVSSKERSALLVYLSDAYTVESLMIMPPFLYLACRQLPTEEHRPFTVAGIVAVWSLEEEADPAQFYLGRPGDAPGIDIPEAFADDIKDQQIPSEETVVWLATHIFTDAIAIALIWHALVIYLPEMSEDAFAARLKELPEYILNSTIGSLYYRIGDRPSAEFGPKREIESDLANINSDEDTSDYVELDGRFYPGTMLSCYGKYGSNSGTAGILVSKDNEKRLIVPYHLCQRAIEENPEDATEGVPLFQGTSKNARGTHVADLVDRIGKSDLGLAKLHQPFENAFMELDCSPKRLLTNDEVQLNDEFLIDSCFTHRRRLKCVGAFRKLARSRPTSHAYPQGDDAPLPNEDIPYIIQDQRLYATNTPYITGIPRMRSGVGGAVLIRCKNAGMKLTSDEVLARGEVAGIMHFADLRGKYSEANNLLCYADGFDEMIGEGWEVATD